MSIIRVGLAETKDFADGYDAIFGKKTAKQEEKKTEATKAPKVKSVKKTAKKPSKKKAKKK